MAKFTKYADEVWVTMGGGLHRLRIGSVPADPPPPPTQWVMVVHVPTGEPVAMSPLQKVQTFFSANAGEGPFEVVPLPGEKIPGELSTGPYDCRLMGRIVSGDHPDNPWNYPGVVARSQWEASLRR